MELEIIMLSSISQTPKDKNKVFSLTAELTFKIIMYVCRGQKTRKEIMEGGQWRDNRMPVLRRGKGGISWEQELPGGALGNGMD